MRFRRSLATPAVALAILVFSGIQANAKKKKVQPAVPQMTADQKVLHALNRLTFGARPHDVEQVKEMGLDQWIERQLHPESIPENPALEAKLQPLDTIRMTSMEMVQHYPSPQLIKAMVDGRVPFPQDAETRHMIQKLVARYERKFDINTGKEKPASDQTADMPKVSLEKAESRLSEDQRHTFENGTVPEKIALFESMPVDEQIDLLDAMPPGARQKFFTVAPPDLRRRIQKFNGPIQVVNQDLSDAKLYRAVYSNRQLEEVFTDFWYNHFNVYLDKGADRYMVTTFERDVIRPHVLGNFKDLLLATAQSPAMLFYLDNWQSVGPEARPNRPQQKNRRGLNENYGRELMELHTLGVDGGYTQHDVTDVARCFTGWTIREPQRGGGFDFNERLHDKGEKTVLGVTIPAGGGMDDGLKVIDILAHHPATARFLSKSLAIRFVSDNPPPALVEKMSRTFLASDGDLRAVMKTMIDAPEFWSKDAWRSKVKTPLEMVASSIRALNGDIDYGFALANQLNQLGEPLYRKQEPTGYSNRSQEWVNSAALLARMNFALNLANGKVPGVKVDLQPFSATDPLQVARNLLLSDLSDAARAAILEGLEEQSAKAPSNPSTAPVALAAGLTLGSPDFQRR